MEGQAGGNPPSRGGNGSGAAREDRPSPERDVLEDYLLEASRAVQVAYSVIRRDGRYYALMLGDVSAQRNPEGNPPSAEAPGPSVPAGDAASSATPEVPKELKKISDSSKAIKKPAKSPKSKDDDKRGGPKERNK